MTIEKDKDTKDTIENKGKYFYGIGRRKKAIAKSRIYPKGKGEVIVNNLEIKKYFTLSLDQEITTAALRETGNIGKFDVSIMTSGGGRRAQAEASRLSIARALLEFDKTLRTSLKPKGYLKRDPRKKERKKPGLKKARRAPQFSKR